MKSDGNNDICISIKIAEYLIMKATQWKLYKKTMPLVYQGEFM